MPKELLAYEKETLGFYISGHPLDRYTGEIRRFTTATCANCMEKGERAEVILAGVINGFVERPMKSGMGKIAYFSLEDQTGRSSSSSNRASWRSSAICSCATSRCW